MSDLVLPTIDLYTIFGILHLLGMGFGLAGATVSDLLFFRAIKDGKVDKKELGILTFFGKVVWTGLLLAVISGSGWLLFYGTEKADWYSESYQYQENVAIEGGAGEFPINYYEYHSARENPKIWAKVTIVIVIILNGVLIHRRIIPLLRESLGRPIIKTKIMDNLTMVLSSGAISLTSWYMAFFMGAWKLLNFTLSYWVMILIYFTVLVCAIIAANVIGRAHLKKMAEKEN